MQIGSRYPQMTGTYLRFLEIYSMWNLRNDLIYISYSSTTMGFVNVSHRIYSSLETGGEVIQETFDT